MTEYIDRDIWKSIPDDLPYKASVKRVLCKPVPDYCYYVKEGNG